MYRISGIFWLRWFEKPSICIHFFLEHFKQHCTLSRRLQLLPACRVTPNSQAQHSEWKLERIFSSIDALEFYHEYYRLCMYVWSNFRQRFDDAVIFVIQIRRWHQIGNFFGGEKKKLARVSYFLSYFLCQKNHLHFPIFPLSAFQWMDRNDESLVSDD